MTSDTISPFVFINSLIGKQVNIKLKWGLQYQGTLLSTDPYMNVEIENITEITNDKVQGTLNGKMIIRCNNIMYIQNLEPDNTDTTTQSKSTPSQPEEEE